MSNALEVITLDQLNALKKIGLIVVHSNPKEANPEITSKSDFNFWNRMVRCSINKQAKEVDWNKIENIQIKLFDALDKFSTLQLEKIELEKFKENSFITFLGEVNEIRSVLIKSSVFVLPSYREGLPRSTIEAMSMQKPVITTDVPGCRQTVIDGLNGFIVEVRNPLALANAMEKFILNPQLIIEMGNQSRKIAVNRFKDSVINESLIDLFRK